MDSKRQVEDLDFVKSSPFVVFFLGEVSACARTFEVPAEKKKV